MCGFSESDLGFAAYDPGAAGCFQSLAWTFVSLYVSLLLQCITADLDNSFVAIDLSQG